MKSPSSGNPPVLYVGSFDAKSESLDSPLVFNALSYGVPIFLGLRLSSIFFCSFVIPNCIGALIGDNFTLETASLILFCKSDVLTFVLTFTDLLCSLSITFLTLSIESVPLVLAVTETSFDVRFPIAVLSSSTDL